MNAYVEALKPYHDFEYELIKLKPASKFPFGRWKTPKALNQEEAEAWRQGGNNIGVRLRSTDLIIDADPRNYKDGVDSLAALIEDFDLTEYACVKSGGNPSGYHLYLTKPADLNVKKALPNKYPGIDFLSSGHYVVAAGSIHPETKHTYEWLNVGLSGMSAAPSKLLNILNKNVDISPPKEPGEVSPKRLAEMLECLDVDDFKDHDRWLKLMMACHFATAGQALSEFSYWSTSDPEYAHETENIKSRWNSLSVNASKNKIKSGTLYKFLIDAGASHMLPRTSPYDDFDPFEHDLGLKLFEFQKSHRLKSNLQAAVKIFEESEVLVPAFDEQLQQPVFKGFVPFISKEKNPPITDDGLRLIGLKILKALDLNLNLHKLKEASRSLALDNRFNPVLDYLNALEWDGVKRLDTFLAKYFGAENNEYSRYVGRTTLIAAVRRVKQPGCKYDTVMILEGKQGSGKSSAIRILGGDWYSDAELGKVDNKESAIMLRGVWLQELGELTALRKSEITSLKSFITRQVDCYRPLYDGGPVNFPRRCILIGTTNADTYLKDFTGNRRFLPVKTHDIDLELLKTDRDQLLAEACVAERTDEAIYLPPKLWKYAEQEAKSRQYHDPWSDEIKKYIAEYDVVPTRLHGQFILNSILCVNSGRQSPLESQRLKKVMIQLGWQHSAAIRIGGLNLGGYLSPEDPNFKS